MMKTSPNLLLATSLVIGAVGLSGCGGMKAASGLSASQLNGSSSVGGGSGAGTPPVAQQNNIVFNGTVNSSLLGNAQVVSIDTVNQLINLSLPIVSQPITQGMTFSVPLTQLPGASLGLAATSSGGTALTFSLPLKYLVKGASFLPNASTLPNGQPLPSVAAGVLPSLALTLPTIKNMQATMYFGKTQVDMYVSVPVNPIISLQVPVTDSNGQTLGYVAMLPATSSTTTGGFFVSISLPAAIQDQIDNLIGGT